MRPAQDACLVRRGRSVRLQAGQRVKMAFFAVQIRVLRLAFAMRLLKQLQKLADGVDIAVTAGKYRP